MHLAAALVARSAGHYAGWGELVEFTACTAARIGETSGVRRADDGMSASAIKGRFSAAARITAALHPAGYGR